MRRPVGAGATATGAAPSAKAAAAAVERCDLCAEPVTEAHRHMLDVQKDTVLCTCGPCSLLFGQSAAGGRHYRLLSGRRTRLEHFRIGAPLWARLGVPVGLAFFVRDGASGEVRVGYPSPLGVTRSAVEAEVWEAVAQGYPELAELADDVEALLVHRTEGADEHWIVPLDDCYRLAALVRTHWRGLSGGTEVREHLDAFFAGLGGAAAQDSTS
ncbi:hypothetical protein DB35_20415 [Streptomyces abyssalis]|uniref:Uncharacterized protein n=1 Tax=Streptomyces abyssalis TaxID=933944 RepID=A0A1E7JV37_9ACTN|nr:hypothetical protein DB35_20415 [Streptomyces abyssalis]OEU93836.1 hypothetical protein AN215_02640 [Streptomyces abyssalis]